MICSLYIFCVSMLFFFSNFSDLKLVLKWNKQHILNVPTKMNSILKMFPIFLMKTRLDKVGNTVFFLISDDVYLQKIEQQLKMK